MGVGSVNWSQQEDLIVVDLAGSESTRRTGETGTRFKDTCVQ